MLNSTTGLKNVSLTFDLLWNILFLINKFNYIKDTDGFGTSNSFVF